MQADVSSPMPTSAWQVNPAYEYEDKEIEKLLELRLQEAGLAENIIIAPAIDAQGTYNLQTYLEAERNTHSGPRKLLIPYNIGRSHWVSIYLHIQANQVQAYYVDPLDKHLPSNSATEQASWPSQAPAVVLRAINTVYPDADCQRLIYYTQEQETQKTSCGVLTVENLIALATDQVLPAATILAQIQAFRQEHIALIERHKAQLDAYFQDFYQRQLNNRPTVASFIEQEGYLSCSEQATLTDEELQKVAELNLLLDTLSEDARLKVLTAIQQPIGNEVDAHRQYLAQIRSVLLNLLETSQTDTHYQEAITVLIERLYHVTSEVFRNNAPALQINIEALKTLGQSEISPIVSNPVLLGMQEIKQDSLMQDKSTAQILFETAQQFYVKGQWQEAAERLERITALPGQEETKEIWQAEIYHKLACCYALQAFNACKAEKPAVAVKAKQAFEAALQQEDLSFSQLETRIHCDYGTFLYQQDAYQAANNQALVVIHSSAKAKSLTYQPAEFPLLLESIQQSLSSLQRNQVYDRTVAYTLLLQNHLKLEAFSQVSEQLECFAGEAYQSVEPVAYEQLAKFYVGLGLEEQARQAISYNQWVNQELKVIDKIQILQTTLESNKLLQDDSLPPKEMTLRKQRRAQTYSQLAQCFATLGDIYHHKKNYPKAAGLYATSMCISGRKLDQTVDEALHHKRMQVEQALLKDAKGETALELTLDTWLLQQASYKSQLEMVRDRARNELAEKLKGLSEKPEEDQPQKIMAIQTIFQHIAQGMRAILCQMLTDCYQVLERPPCNYAILGLGSFARKEATPYSDLEWAILMEDMVDTWKQLGNDNYEELGRFYNQQYKSYFRQLADLMYVKVTSLGETILPSLAIPSLNSQYFETTWEFFDTFMPRGFAMDGAMSQACKMPQGKRDRQGRQVYELIGTVVELASYVGQTPNGRYWIDLEPLLPMVMVNVSLIEGEQNLVDAYRRAVKLTLQQTHEPSQLPLYRYSMKKLLGESLKEIAFNPYTGKPGQVFDPKKNLYRLPNLIIDELALYCKVDAHYVSGLSKVVQLREKGILQPDAAQRLAYVLSETIRFRIQTYLHYDKQLEKMNPLLRYFTTEGKISSQYTLQNNDVEILKYILQVLMPLYETMLEFNDNPEAGEQQLRKAVLYANDVFRQGVIALRLYQYRTALIYFQQVVEERKLLVDKPHSEVAISYNNMGFIYDALGNANRALDCYQKALGTWQMLPGKQDAYVAISYNNIGTIHQVLGNSKQALVYCKGALSRWQSLYGDQHLDVAMSYKNIGLIYQALGDDKQALVCCQKALKICQRLHSSQPSDVAMSYISIGEIYRTLGDVKQALDCYQKALKIWQMQYGKLHPDVAMVYNNIGIVYDALGNKEQALAYCQKALKIWQTLYGERHPMVAMSYNNIGEVYRALNDTRQALTNFQKAFNIRRALYGKGHPMLAMSYISIGGVHRNIGNSEQALIYYQDALKILLPLYSEWHSDVATVYNNIGETYRISDKAVEALNYYQKALRIWLRLYGETHPDVAISYNNIGAAYAALGNVSQALIYYQKALEIWQVRYGEQHPHVAMAYNNIGELHRNLNEVEQDLNEVKQALAYYQKALDIWLALYGKGHYHVAMVYYNIAATYYAFDKYEQALACYQEALKIWLALYDERHPDVAMSYNEIGTTYYAFDKYEQALVNYQKALKIWRTLYGEQHIDVAICYNNIAAAYYTSGKKRQALDYYYKSLNVYQSALLYDNNHPMVIPILSKIKRLEDDLKKQSLSVDTHLQQTRPNILFEGFNSGFFNSSSLATYYEVNQSVLNQTIRLLNELAETNFHGYFRKGKEPFIVDAVLEGTRELLTTKKQILSKYHISCEIKPVQSKFYLMVYGTNITAQAERVFKAYNSAEAIVKRTSRQCFNPS